MSEEYLEEMEALTKARRARKAELTRLESMYRVAQANLARIMATPVTPESGEAYRFAVDVLESLWDRINVEDLPAAVRIEMLKYDFCL